MGILWPDPPALPVLEPCAHCRTPARADRLVHGMGSGCARKLGLITSTPRVRTDPQAGPSLLDYLTDEPEDHCDGHDR